MKRWHLVVHYLDKGSKSYQFSDIQALGVFQRKIKPWRMEPPQQLQGPALSPDEYADGARIKQSGKAWVMYEPFERKEA